MLLAPKPTSRRLHHCTAQQHMGDEPSNTTSRTHSLHDEESPSNRDGEEQPSGFLRPRTGVSTTALAQHHTSSSNVSHLDVGPLKQQSPGAAATEVAAATKETSIDATRGNTFIIDSTSSASSAQAAAALEASSSEESPPEDAVREDDEGNHNDEETGNGLHCDGQRQSPSPSPSISSSTGSSRRQPLRSSLRSSPSVLKKKSSHKVGRSCNYRTKRRIRGLWGNADDNHCPFGCLHDETVLLLMKHLSMKDLCVASMVCQRWKYLALQQDAWKRIDATDFVQEAHLYYSSTTTTKKNGTTSASANASPSAAAATKATSLSLAARMERYSPDALSIHSIQHRLSADNFLTSLPSLQELTLTYFHELTDTHIHVLLLSSSCKNVQARSKRTCIMRKLVLEDCPLLTDATVQSVGNLCPELEELSLKGNPNIQDLSPLQELWTLSKKPQEPKPAPFAAVVANKASSTSVASLSIFASPAASASSSPSSSMSMLFSSPPPSTPSTPRPSTPTNALQSLFALPGQSPPRTSKVVSLMPRQLSKRNSNSKTKVQGKLARLDVSNTGVTASSLLKTWMATIPPRNWVQLEQLIMNGNNGASWNDALMEKLADTLDMTQLQCFEIATACNSHSSNNVRGGAQVSDKGLRQAFVAAGSGSRLQSLKKLNLSGHTTVTSTGIAEVITAAESTLEELLLDGCKGISAQTGSPASDFTKVDALATAILKCATRRRTTTNNDISSSSGGRGLRRLSLARCFSSQQELQQQEQQPQKSTAARLQHEETLGTYLLEALGPKQTKKASSSLSSPHAKIATLCELDLSHCWFLTNADLSALHQRCPGLHTIRLEGTRAATPEC